MSKALPGSHYCEDHQGNYSHYAKHNCELCKALAERDALRAAAEDFCKKVEAGLAKSVDSYKKFKAALAKGEA